MCPGVETVWTSSRQDQIDMFFDQGDFGYVKQQQEEIGHICEPSNQVIYYITIELIII